MCDPMFMLRVDKLKLLGNFEGTVIEGMDVVYKVEKVGSQGGKTTKKVTIVDSGELSL